LLDQFRAEVPKPQILLFSKVPGVTKYSLGKYTELLSHEFQEIEYINIQVDIEMANE